MKGSPKSKGEFNSIKGKKKIKAPKRSVNLSMLSETENQVKKIRNFSPMRKKKGGNATPAPDKNAENTNQ